YVSSSYLTSTKPRTSTASPSTPPAPTPEAKTQTKYVKVNSGSLNMRNSASSNASIIVKLAKGKEVKVYSESNGWAKIEAFGQIGYVSSQYLTTLKQSENNSSIPEIITTKYVNVSSSLNVRESASLNGKVLITLTKGTEVTVYSESNGWAKIAVNGQVGYVSVPYLSETKPIVGSSPELEQTMETKYVNISIGSSLNMRNHPSADSSIIVKLARGTEVTVYSEADGWAEIKAYEQLGYVSSDYLSSTKTTAGTESSLENGPDPSNENTADEIISKYVNVIYGSTLNMRTEPTTSATIMTKLSRGTVVTVYSEENDWARITANGQTGYVSSQYLSTIEPYNPSTSDKNDEKTFEQYQISLKDLTDIQMAVKPQTDKKYQTYIREDALVLTSSSSGTVKGTSWNVRGGAGTDYWVVGTVKNGTTLPIISKIMGNDGYYWYQIDYNKSWVNASPEDVTYYLDPTNFLSTTVDSLQFLKLSVSANLNVDEVNERILAGKGILEGTASAFVTAGEMYNVNEVYLIAHALLETGKGTSQLATGVNVNGKTVYNMYGIGAYDGTALTSGAQYANNAGWFTPEAAIIGGAKFIAQGYISAGQDTLYKMRWNPSSAVVNGYASRQYATDIGWAAKQVNQIHNLYHLIDSYTLVLDIPTYK
ncbi:SH3 domain-containing protein, partial [Metabacillus rhizolycopersici]